MPDDLPRKKALIISVSQYNDPELDKIRYVENDGKEMYQTLTQLGYDIPPDRKLIGNLNYNSIRHAVINFFQDKNHNPQDTLLLYFSGHGDTDGYKDRFFCSSEYDRNKPDVFGIPFKIINEQIPKSISKKIIVVLDCCFSGGLVLEPGKSGDAKGEDDAEKQGNEALNDEFRDSKGVVVLASSLSNRKSFKHPQKETSAFTSFFIEGIKGADTAVDEQGYVTPEKLDEYIFSGLKNLVGGKLQRPQRTSQISGRLSLAHYPEKAQVDEYQIEKVKNKLFELLRNEKIFEFNKLREEHNHFPLDLSEFEFKEDSNLSRIQLVNVKIENCKIRNVNFSNSNIFNTNFREVFFTDCKFDSCHITDTAIQNSKFIETSLYETLVDGCEFEFGCNFECCDGKNIIFKNCNFNRTSFFKNDFSSVLSTTEHFDPTLEKGFIIEMCEFINCSFNEDKLNRLYTYLSRWVDSKFESTNWKESVLSATDFLSCDFTNTRMEDTRLLPPSSFLKCNFHNCNLHNQWANQVNFSYSIFSKTNFNGIRFLDTIMSQIEIRDSTMEDAMFKDSTLRRCIIERCILSNSKFWESDLRNSKLTGSDISYADFRHAVLKKSDLSEAINQDLAKLQDAILIE